MGGSATAHPGVTQWPARQQRFFFSLTIYRRGVQRFVFTGFSSGNISEALAGWEIDSTWLCVGPLGPPVGNV